MVAAVSFTMTTMRRSRLFSRRTARTRTFSCLAVVSVSLVAIASAVSGCKDDATATPTPEAGCIGQPLLVPYANSYRGDTLGMKQLALTFDDGPGPQTGELSTYLKSENVRAAFFVNGMYADNAALLAQIVADGHILANHTHNHLSLNSAGDFPAGAVGDAKLIKELSDTDDIIAPYVVNNRFLFRAPFGDFGTRAYTTLHASAMDKYYGHVDWDIGGERTATTAADWACWQNNPKLSNKECGDLYKMEIDARPNKNGIVLLHDQTYGNAANTAPTASPGNTVSMIKYLVPVLKADGFTFKRVDEVPAIAAVLPPLPQDAGPDANDGGDAGDAGDGGDAGHADAGADSGKTDSGVTTVPSPTGTGTANPPPGTPCP